MKKLCFYSFRLIFWSWGGAPGASWDPLGDQVGLQVAFSMVFGGPGEALGLLCGSFGGAFGALGPTLAPKVGSKVRKRPVSVHIGPLSRFLLQRVIRLHLYNVAKP